MAEIIGVRFQSAGKIYFFDADQLEISAGEHVIVETSRGIEFGEVMMGKHFRKDESLPMPLKKVIRVATEQDKAHSQELKQHEKDAYGICQKKILEHKLEMKLVSVEAAFDNSKLLFYFTANGRVDFRSLVKDLASVFKTRIELRQIGVRDEAKMLGGLGPCGRPICCGTFLGDFEPVSIKMAKEQNLSLNPTKISGVCGRLMCCLKYEEDDYEQTRKRMPKVGKEVITPDGKGYVTDLNIVKETVKVRVAKGDEFEVDEYVLDDIQKIGINGEPIVAEETEQAENAAEEADVEAVETVTEAETAPVTQEETETKPEPEQKPAETRENGEQGSEKHSRNDKRDKPWKKRENNRDGNPNNDRDKQLGKPVRRENREKKDFRKEDEKPVTVNTQNVQNTAPVQASAPVAEPVAAPKPKNNWKAALEAAMKAAEEK